MSSYQKFFYLKRPVPATAGTLLGLPSISQCCGFAGETDRLTFGAPDEAECPVGAEAAEGIGGYVPRVPPIWV